VVKKSFHIDEVLDDAFIKFLEKTKSRPSTVIRDALEKFIVEEAHTTIPLESARVETMQKSREMMMFGKMMKQIKSAGMSAVNLEQTMRDINGMALPEEKKSLYRDIAEYYDAFKSNGASKLVKLVKTAYPTATFQKRMTSIELRWKTEKCSGCSNVGNKKFCYLNCKSFRKDLGLQVEKEAQRAR
jgi:hypothetical protein